MMNSKNMELFRKVDYNKDLNPKQKESYNFQKISGILADFGYITYRMFDDYNGADFHAVRIDGQILKIQLKGRFEILKKYYGKGLYIAFCYKSDWYIYPHDYFYELTLNNSQGAKKNEGRSIGKIPKWLDLELSEYKLM